MVLPWAGKTIQKMGPELRSLANQQKTRVELDFETLPADVCSCEDQAHNSFSLPKELLLMGKPGHHSTLRAEGYFGCDLSRYEVFHLKLAFSHLYIWNTDLQPTGALPYLYHPSAH